MQVELKPKHPSTCWLELPCTIATLVAAGRLGFWHSREGAVRAFLSRLLTHFQPKNLQDGIANSRSSLYHESIGN